ncbi:MAG: putative porin [Chlamydiota bacterium]
MKSIKYLLLFFFVAIITNPPAYSACDSDCDYDIGRCDTGETQFEQDLDERDWDALYDYINTKRTINVNEKSCNLTISGDVRAQWKRKCEEDYYGRIRRIDKGDYYKYIGKDKYNMEFNLRFDYVCDRAWAVAHLQYDNTGGICSDHSCKKDPEGMHGSGSGCDLDLKKAYIGYNLCCDGCTRFDIEVGRRRLYQVFDSQVQFLSRFDGIMLKYDSCSDCLGDWYVHAAGFIVDARVDHYAYLIETGLYELCDTGFEVKYSFVDWRKHGKNYCRVKDAIGTRFMNSQFTLYYHLNPDFICKPAKAFAALIWNHDAYVPSEKKLSHYRNDEPVYKREPKANLAWYAGFSVGEVVYQGDWAVNVQYQWVEARSIPDDDVSGIGNGNCRNYSFTSDGLGNTNFKGWRLEALYAFTDNISLDLRAEWSRAIDDAIYFGGEHKYSQVRLEAIYAF